MRDTDNHDYENSCTLVYGYSNLYSINHKLIIECIFDKLKYIYIYRGALK